MHVVLAVVIIAIIRHTEALGRCYPSSRGYQCMLIPCSGIQVHWSLGGPPPSDSLTCSFPVNSTSNGTVDAVAALQSNLQGWTVHIALVSTEETGWVGMAAPRIAGMMAPGDAVVGWFRDDGHGTVTPFDLQNYDMPNYPDYSYNVSNTGIVRQPGSLTVCFTRMLSDLGKSKVSWGIDPMPWNFGAGDTDYPAEHRKRCRGTDLNPQMSLHSYIDTQDMANFQAAADNKPEDNEEEEEEEKASHLTHGWLMLLTWTLIFPLGMLAPRYRDLVAGWPLLSRLKAPWFALHMGCQWAGIGMFITSMATIMRSEGMEVHRWAGLMRAHGGIGITLIITLGLHVLIAAIRPSPAAPRRDAWLAVHKWGARINILLGLTNCLIGPKLYYNHTLDQANAAGMYVGIGLLALLVLLVVLFAKWQAAQQARLDKQPSGFTMTPPTVDAEAYVDVLVGQKSGAVVVQRDQDV